jgi:hypothetical protein
VIFRSHMYFRFHFTVEKTEAKRLMSLSISPGCEYE